MRYLLSRICQLVGAQNASWIGAVRGAGDFSQDPLSGWRPRVVFFLHPFADLVERSRQNVKDLDRGEIDPSIVRNVAGAGTFRANRLVDLMPPAWFESAYFQATYRNKGREDAIWAAVPVSADAECYFGIYRGLRTPRFSPEERDAVGYLIRGLKWFLRRHMLSHGLLVARTPLTPTERKVLHGLLAGWSEKEIAAKINQSYNTTHAHVGMLYRKFEVKNRSALMALWM